MVNLNIDGNLSAKNIDKIEEKIDKNGYGEIAGGKNIISPNCYKLVNYWVNGGESEITSNYGQTCAFVPVEAGKTYMYTSSNASIGFGGCCFANANKESINVSACTYANSNSPQIITVPSSASYFVIGSYNSNINYQLEEGTQATSYEPYFPSNKMLVEENTQQSTEMMDIKMLGWSVPRECPVQNEVNGNQFIQKVGRVDLSSLSYTYEPENVQFYSGILSSLPQEEKWNFNLYCNKYPTGFRFGDSFIDSYIASYGGRIYIRDKNYTNGSTLVAGLKNTYLYYELATPITTTIDGNEIGETVSDVRKETTVNLLNPTLETTTQNGVTCTNNGDGTYTLNGTANANDTMFELYGFSYDFDYDSLLFIDCSHSFKTSDTDTRFQIKETTTWDYVVANDKNNYVAYINKGTFGGKNVVIRFVANNGDSFNNTIIKPMITTNLNATYDDFVPYTGSTGALNTDVASLLARIKALEAKMN